MIVKAWHMLAALAASFGPMTTEATILVNQEAPWEEYYVGGSELTAFTAALGATPGGYVTGGLTDTTAMAASSALVIVMRSIDMGDYGSVGTDQLLSDAEAAAVAAYIAGGRRVLLIGENASWSNWDTSILRAASGASTATIGTFRGTLNPIVANEITAGVGSFDSLAIGTHSVAGGTQLFDQPSLTLWGGRQNALTVLDINLFDDRYGVSRLRQNIVDWLYESPAAVPEPATWSMLVAGFALVGGTMRRARRASLATA